MMKKKMAILIFYLLGFIIGANAQQHWTLEDCIAHALAHNPELRNKAIEADIKEQDWLMAKNERLPSVNGYANMYSNFGHSQDVFGTIQRNDNLNSNMGITAEIMLYNFGALKNKIQKSQTDKQVALLEREVLERELTVRVIQAYLDILLKSALVEAQDSARVHAERLFARAKRTAEVGTTAQTEVHEAKAALAREQQRLETARIDVERARLQLAQLMLLEDGQDLALVPLPVEGSLNLLETTGEDAMESAFALHPALHRLDTLQRGLTFERQLLRAQYYPVLKGSTSIGSTYFNPFHTAGKSPFFLQTKDNFAQQVAITATIPIFNKGRTRRQLKQLDLAQEQLTWESLREKQEIRRQLQQLMFDLRSNQQQYTTAGEVMEQTEKAMTLTRKSYEAGRSSIYDYNNSRNQYIQAQSDWIQARYSTLFSRKMLHYQLTGKWKEE